MDETFELKMSAGPRLYSFRRNMNYYGAYKNLSLGEQEAGKTLQVKVDSGNRPVCWIELWRGHYDGGNWVNWTTQRGPEPVLLSGDKPQADPVLSWTIVPGDYMLYFVTANRTKDVVDTSLKVQIKTG